MKKPVTAAIKGLCNRGNDIYAHYQLAAPEEMKVVEVADPAAKKRETAREEYGVAPENCFETSIQSHIIALAAEYSRIHEGESVDLEEFIKSEEYKEL